MTASTLFVSINACLRCDSNGANCRYYEGRYYECIVKIPTKATFRATIRVQNSVRARLTGQHKGQG